MLTIDQGATEVKLEEAMHNHILATGQLMGRYERVGAKKKK